MAYVKLGAMAEGSIVRLNEDGAPVEFYVAKQDYEPELNGTGRVLLVRKRSDGEYRKFHSVKYALFGDSDIDVWFNGEYKSRLDLDIQTAMGSTKFYCAVGNGSISVLERPVFTLSCVELGVTASWCTTGDGTKLETADILLPPHPDDPSINRNYWTRTHSNRGYSVSLGVINPSASGISEYTYYANEAYSDMAMGLYLPCYTLPATLSVGKDGTVVTNTEPTAPSSITIPSQINGGSTITVEWGPASDAEDNLAGYLVERSVDGGSSWTQIYQGGASSTTNLAPFGAQSVMYRVKAYDAEGLESGWTASAQVTVINNTAPTAPGSITVPEAVQGGQPLAVSWGASSDSENNLTGYSLERQVDGGAWAVLYTGNELSFTDSITKGWLTVAYRVRAFDQYNAYSGFTTSETREVNNNTPPVITCEHPSGTLLGVKNEDFAISYSVTDEEGDEVTVTEAVDGAVWRTFTAELGKDNSFTLAGADFMRVLNGRHTLDLSLIHI